MADEKFDWKVLEDKPVLVYGAGTVSRFVAKMLVRNNIDLIGMAVTTLTEENAWKCDDIQIRELTGWLDYSSNSIVLVATSKVYHEEIKQYCLSHGFSNFIFLDSQLLHEAIKSYFSEKGVPVDKDYLEVGNGKYINPIEYPIPFENILVSCLGDFIVPPVYNDFSMIHEGPYEFGEVCLSEGDIVFDLGANLGCFSVYAASKNCVSYAFEPTQDLKSIIDRHSNLNKGLIHYEPYAVSNETGKAHFLIHPLTVSGNTLIDEMLLKYDEDIKYTTVQQISIDDFVKQEKLERVDFIKADIEGAERLMLEGAAETLKQFAPKLSLCTYHLPDDKEVLTDLILKVNPNYKIEYKWEKLFAHV